ncbi:septum formation family protein [Corynebacterium sp. P3-F1]|uniref:septum formation family protein n=1 Tax=Corynebacterium sp. P3-F1 TaxID=3059080 RepID=UPI00265CAAB6|nr:septum formation family protein [Corynebacterium sp. P3-F1]WKK60520.1 septum formation family protein [Corynebacterium sp. P3-F1]
MAAQKSSLSTSGLRTVLVATLAGALGVGTFALATGYADQGPAGADTARPSAPATEGEEPTPSFTAADRGTCLTWDVGPDGEVTGFTETDCNNEHRFEVSSREDLNTYPTAEFGPDAEAPNPTRQAQLREELCQTASIRYLNGRYDPAGRYSIAPILPPAEAWERGDRTMLCGLQETDSEGTPILTTGHAADQDQARVAEPGACEVTDDAKNVGYVDCSEPHHIEVTDVVDLAPVFADRTPSPEDQDKHLGQVCAKAAENYLGNEENLYQSTLQVYWGTISPQAWDGGSRSVNCGLIAPKDGRFATITGTAKDGRDALKVDGQTPEAPPERRPLREEQKKQQEAENAANPGNAASASAPAPAAAPQP